MLFCLILQFKDQFKKQNKTHATQNIQRKINRYLYFLHELANFLNRRLFEFQQFGLLEKFLLHVYQLALKLLQSLPPLLAEPGRGWWSQVRSSIRTCTYITTSTKTKKGLSYLAWLVSFFADWRAKTSSSFSFCSESTADCRVCTFFWKRVRKIKMCLPFHDILKYGLHVFALHFEICVCDSLY